MESYKNSVSDGVIQHNYKGKEEEMRYNRYAQPDFISYEELFEKLGYKKQYQPQIGSVGRAIMEASKNHRSVNWLKNQLDTYFERLRGKRDSKKDEIKGRKRYPIQRNG